MAVPFTLFGSFTRAMRVTASPRVGGEASRNLPPEKVPLRASGDRNFGISSVPSTFLPDWRSVMTRSCSDRPVEAKVWQDTVMVPPAGTALESGQPVQYPGYVRVRLKFDSLGAYMWHCHILSHEENEMMRSFLVVPTGSGN